MSIRLAQNTYVEHRPRKGWCVFSSIHLRKGQLVEEAPVLPCPWDGPSSILDDYRMTWDGKEDCLTLGNINLMNHSTDAPNVHVVNNHKRLTKQVFALRNIRRGEELCFTYQCPIWFAEEP